MPKLVDHEQRRKLFIVSAMNVLASKGYDAFNLRSVAEEAGFSTGAMAHYFEDRESLLLAVFHFYAAQLSSQVKALLDVPDAPAEKIRKLLLYMLPDNSQRRAGWKIWFELSRLARSEQDLQKIRLGLYAEWGALLEGLYQAGKPDQATLNPGASCFFSTHLLAWLEGFTLQVLVDPARYEPEQQYLFAGDFLDHLFGADNALSSENSV